MNSQAPRLLPSGLGQGTSGLTSAAKLSPFLELVDGSPLVYRPAEHRVIGGDKVESPIPSQRGAGGGRAQHDGAVERAWEAYHQFESDQAAERGTPQEDPPGFTHPAAEVGGQREGVLQFRLLLPIRSADLRSGQGIALGEQRVFERRFFSGQHGRGRALVREALPRFWFPGGRRAESRSNSREPGS
jgi:hypothetical protein